MFSPICVGKDHVTVTAEGKKVKKKAKTQDSAVPMEQAGSAHGEDLRVELYEDEDATR